MLARDVSSHRRSREKETGDNGGGGGGGGGGGSRWRWQWQVEERGTAGINNNYWFEPLSIRDLSNLKITSEINYVRLISSGIRSIYRHEYYMDEAFSLTLDTTCTRRVIQSLLFSVFRSPVNSFPLDTFAAPPPSVSRLTTRYNVPTLLHARNSLFVGKIDIVKTLTSLSQSNTFFPKLDRRDDDIARNSRRYTYIYVLQRS